MMRVQDRRQLYIAVITIVLIIAATPLTLTSAISFVSFFLFLFRPLAHWLEQVFRTLLGPPPQALVRGALTDLTYTKAELIVENAKSNGSNSIAAIASGCSCSPVACHIGKMHCSLSSPIRSCAGIAKGSIFSGGGSLGRNPNRFNSHRNHRLDSADGARESHLGCRTHSR
jgi:hypothetical protein